MQFNFTFTFPEVSELNNIVISCDETYMTEQGLLFRGPALPKILNQPSFAGWTISNVYGDMPLLAAESLLTKGNIFNFDTVSVVDGKTVYNTIIECKIKWVPTLAINMVWRSFNPAVATTSMLGEAILGTCILGN